MLERLQQIQAGGLPNGLSFKDVLVQFANMQQANQGLIPNRPPETITNRPEHHIRPEGRRRQERNHEDVHVSVKQAERLASPSPRLPPPPPYPEISLLPVTTSQETSQQNSLLHGILTKVFKKHFFYHFMACRINHIPASIINIFFFLYMAIMLAN